MPSSVDPPRFAWNGLTGRSRSVANGASRLGDRVGHDIVPGQRVVEILVDQLDKVLDRGRSLVAVQDNPDVPLVGAQLDHGQRSVGGFLALANFEFLGVLGDTLIDLLEQSGVRLRDRSLVGRFSPERLRRLKIIPAIRNQTGEVGNASKGRAIFEHQPNDLLGLPHVVLVQVGRRQTDEHFLDRLVLVGTQLIQRQ